MTEALTYGSLQYFTEHEIIVLKTPEGKLVALRPPEGTQGEVIVLGQAPAFGEISINDNTTETSISEDVWGQVTVFDTNGKSKNMTPDHVNDHIVIGRNGIYFVSVSVAIESIAGAALELELQVFTNNGNTEFTNIHVHRDLAGGGGEVGAVPLTGLALFTEGDTVELWVMNETNDQNVIIADATMTVFQVGRE